MCRKHGVNSVSTQTRNAFAHKLMMCAGFPSFSERLGGFMFERALPVHPYTVGDSTARRGLATHIFILSKKMNAIDCVGALVAPI